MNQNASNVNRASKQKNDLPIKMAKVTGIVVAVVVGFIAYMNFMTDDPNVELVTDLNTAQNDNRATVESVLKSSETNAAIPGLAGSGVTADDEAIIMMSEEECWKYITNNLYSSQPQGKWIEESNKLNQLESQNKVQLTIKCWVWKNPDSNSHDLTKIESTDTIDVNVKLKDILEHVFTDIFNDPSQPVWNTSDAGRGCYVNRGKRQSPYNKPSTHAYGCAVDFNPGTKVTVNGIHSGNGAGTGYHVLTKSEWEQLPETQDKYNCIYKGCQVEKIFKSYGFVWGGDWSGYRDVMHFSFIGEGVNTRKQGQKNYKDYKAK